jgi:hypothetical protein
MNRIDERIIDLKKYRLDNKMIWNNTTEYIEHIFDEQMNREAEIKQTPTEEPQTTVDSTDEEESVPISTPISESIQTQAAEPKSTPISEPEPKPEPIAEPIPIQSAEVKKISTIYYPKEKDSLFWCLYIMKYGYKKYNLLIHKHTICEKNLKLSWIETLRKNKVFVKNISFDAIMNIEDNLVNDTMITINTFMVLCSLEKYRVIILNDEKKYYWDNKTDNTDQMTDNVYVIHIKQITNIYNNYGVEKLDNYINNEEKYNSYLYIENWKKPIKSVSQYRVNELIELATKINIQYLNKDGKNKRKAELYEEIKRYFPIMMDK